jgi:uncharacterized membrane protein
MTMPIEATKPNDVDRILAAVSHFAILGGFWLIVPAAIYVWKRQTSRFVAFHALQAAILAVAVIPLWIFSVMVCVAIGVASAALHLPGLAFFDTALVAISIVFCGVVTLMMAVYGGIQALRGRGWSMPLIGRLARRVVEAPTKS